MNYHIQLHICIYTGWWFQTCFISHNIWYNPSHWLIFFRGLKPPTSIYIYIKCIKMIQMSSDPARQENSLAHCRWAFSGTPFEEKWQVQWGKYVKRSENIRKWKNDDSHESIFLGGCPMVQSYFRETHVFFTMFESPEVGPMVFHDL